MAVERPHADVAGTKKITNVNRLGLTLGCDDCQGNGTVLKSVHFEIIQISITRTVLALRKTHRE